MNSHSWYIKDRKLFRAYIRYSSLLVVQHNKEIVLNVLTLVPTEQGTVFLTAVSILQNSHCSSDSCIVTTEQSL
jgi:hypothetical protein